MTIQHDEQGFQSIQPVGKPCPVPLSLRPLGRSLPSAIALVLSKSVPLLCDICDVAWRLADRLTRSS